MTVSEQPGEKILTIDQNDQPPLQTEFGNHGLGGEVGEGIQRHPFLNDVILRGIFRSVRCADILICRTVCKKWNILTIPFTRSKFYINIYGDHSTEKSSGSTAPGTPERTTHNIRDFVQNFTANKFGIPISRFRLGSFSTTDGAGQQFLNLCGDTIKEILFFVERFYIEDVSEILKSTPKLETFQIPQRIYSRSVYPVKLFSKDCQNPKLSALKNLYFCQEYSITRFQCCPTFAEELFAAAENVSNLFLCDLLPGHMQFSTSLEVLSVIQKLGRESMIQNLHISHVMSEHVEILRRMVSKKDGLKLRKLDYKTNPETRRNVVPIQFVNLFKETLQHLYIEDNCAHFNEFPKFLALKDLKMKNMTDLNSRGVKLNRIFPALQKLSLHSKEYETVHEFLPDSEPSRSVTSLEFHCLVIKINAFNQILTVFPNLIKLCLNIGEDGVEILRLIFIQMTQLEKLRILGDIPTTMETMDSLLTGIPMETILNIPDVLNGLDELAVEVRRKTIFELRSQHSRFPSIVNLTNLRYLELHVSVEMEARRWSDMTDLSGYLAFYSMKHLTVKFLGRCKFTETCREVLMAEAELDCRYFGK